MKAASRLFLLIVLLMSSLTSLQAQATTSQPGGQYVQYYFVELIPNDSMIFSPEKARSIQVEHMTNIKRMVEESKLLLAGPFVSGGGLFILNTSKFEEAKAWIDQDPAVLAGRFRYKLRLWITEKGLLNLEK